MVSGVLLYLMHLAGMFAGPAEKVILNVLIGLSYCGLFFFPKNWWNKRRAGIAVIIVTLETAANLIWYQETELLYLLVIVIFYARLQSVLSKWLGPAVAALLIAAMFYVRFGQPNPANIISYILLTFALFYAIRAELQEAYDQLQEATATTMRFAILEERTRIARDIHDSVGHSITSLIVQLQAMRYMIKQDPAQAERALDGMLAVARQGLGDIRSAVHALADDQSLSGAASLKALLSRMEATAGIRYTFHNELWDEDMGDLEFGTLFKMLQEAITNAVRHSRATELEVGLRREAGDIVMTIRDDGALLYGEGIAEGFGLRAMKARLEERGGRLRYGARKPHGFDIVAHIPAGSREDMLTSAEKDGKP